MIQIFGWIAVLVASFAATWQLYEAFAVATSAPQQAAGAALAAAIAIIPYCTARAIESLSKNRQLEQIRELLETHTKLLASLANDSSPRVSRKLGNDLSGIVLREPGVNPE